MAPMTQPSAVGDLSQASASTVSRWLKAYRAMLSARLVDAQEASLIAQGEASFHVSGGGHEGSAMLAEYLQPEDYLHLHYRDKALMLARGLPVAQFFHSLLGTAGSHSQGRQMSAHISDPPRHILSIVGPVGNHALQAAGLAASLKDRSSGGIVICSLGDGTTQQGEVLEAIAEAVRSQLPVLFWVSDNQLSISTRTPGRTFFSRPDGDATEFYGIPIQRLNGRDPVRCDDAVRTTVESMRSRPGPAIILFQVDRLSDHTNADDERVYRTPEERAGAKAQGDPIHNLRAHLLGWGVSPGELQALEAQLSVEIRKAADEARSAPSPKATFTAKRPLSPQEPALRSPASSARSLGGARETQPASGLVSGLGTIESAGTLTMAEAIRGVLERRLSEDERVTLYGQDIEDPKGDVFGVTRGLSTDFPGRVMNAPLTESTIVGVSIGRALAGDRPVAMLQFSDFLPLALNQVITEMATMYWRTAGGWEAPVVLMAPAGGYRPGLGPFHAQSFETLAAHVPGLDVVMPATAADAARLLNAAFDSHRPTLFFYPKALLHNRDDLAPAQVIKEATPLGVARYVSRGDDLTFVAWGNTVSLCSKAADSLKALGFGIDVLDLRSFSPWDRDEVVKSAQRTGRVVVVHEENLTAGFGAEVLASVAESSRGTVQMRRVTRADTFVPFEYANQSEVLPSFQSVLDAAAELLDLDITWTSAHAESEDSIVVRARGASPTDQETMVVEWRVEVGETIAEGAILAELESDKAITELASPTSGTVVELLVPPSEKMPVGTPVARIAPTVQTGNRSVQRGPLERQPRLTRKPLSRRATERAVEQSAAPRSETVVISVPSAVTGSLTLTNALLAERFAGRNPEEIKRLCGIVSRRRVASTESALTMAVAAAARALAQANLSVNDLDAIVCHTTTPLTVTPAMASQIQAALSAGDPHTDVAAYDIHAACSGYLYALQIAFDAVQTRPESRILVVTTEEMSRVVDPRDFDTAILFGDAATATLVGGQPHGDGHSGFRMRRPVLFARPDETGALAVPNPGSGFVSMRGREVFSEAIRSMIQSLNTACQEAAMDLNDLTHVVPHQANGRILEAMSTRLGVLGSRVISNIATHGNTSSSSIPLCLAETTSKMKSGDKVGLCAFGGGFTWGAAILETL